MKGPIKAEGIENTALRTSRIVQKAEVVFGSCEKASRWLRSDNLILAAKPLELLATEAGAREVDAELSRIDSGDFT